MALFLALLVADRWGSAAVACVRSKIAARAIGKSRVCESLFAVIPRSNGAHK